VKLVFIQEILPHYRFPLLKLIGLEKEINLTVVTSAVGHSEGYFYPKQDTCFKLIELKKISFKFLGMKCVVLRKLMCTIFSIKPAVVITTGNKSFIQNFLILLAKKVIRYRLYYFQHAKNYENNRHISNAIIDFYQKEIICRFTDGLILYTENEAVNLIEKGYPSQKIFYANNTIDTERLLSHNELKENCLDIYQEYKINKKPAILFIGRLVPGKEMEALFYYFKLVKNSIKNIQLIIIGSGEGYKKYSQDFIGDDINFLGSIYDEEAISCFMRIAKFVFNPGYTGLNIMHAFANGKPYVTFHSSFHKPEIYYLEDDVNGLILNIEDEWGNVEKIIKLIEDDGYNDHLSRNAIITAKKYTIKNMAKNFIEVILN
jgi:glycosyltransferase involved in cell wall biosynthesis